MTHIISKREGEDGSQNRVMATEIINGDGKFLEVKVVRPDGSVVIKHEGIRITTPNNSPTHPQSGIGLNHNS